MPNADPSTQLFPAVIACSSEALALVIWLFFFYRIENVKICYTFLENVKICYTFLENVKICYTFLENVKICYTFLENVKICYTFLENVKICYTFFRKCQDLLHFFIAIGQEMSLQPIFQNFRISDFYPEFEEELSFFAYSEILKIDYRDIFLADGPYHQHKPLALLGITCSQKAVIKQIETFLPLQFINTCYTSCIEWALFASRRKL